MNKTISVDLEKTLRTKIQRFKVLERLADLRDFHSEMEARTNQRILEELAAGYTEGMSRNELAPAIRRTEGSIRAMELRCAK